MSGVAILDRIFVKKTSRLILEMGSSGRQNSAEMNFTKRKNCPQNCILASLAVIDGSLRVTLILVTIRYAEESMLFENGKP
jgi:hypothetical protein